MKLRINRFADADNVNVSINVKTSGGKGIKNMADSIAKLDAEVTKVDSRFKKFQSTINALEIAKPLKMMASTLNFNDMKVQIANVEKAYVGLLKKMSSPGDKRFTNNMTTLINQRSGAHVPDSIANPSGSTSVVQGLTQEHRALIDVMTGVATGMTQVGDAVSTNTTKMATYRDMIGEVVEKQKLLNPSTGAVEATSVTSSLGSDPTTGISSLSQLVVNGYGADKLSMIKEVNSAIKDTGAAISGMGKDAEDGEKKLTGFQKLLSKLPKNMKEFESGIRSLSLVRMMYIGGMLKRVFSSVFSAVKGASDYTESLNLAIMSFGKQGNINVYDKYIKDWAFGENGISTKLLLDQQELLQYVGTFNNLTKGLGVASEDAITMSKNLTQLTYDMSSYLNIDVESASAKLVSAMNGETRAVGKAGVAMQAASLQELAYTLGIDKKVAKMTQAEKTYLRYIQVMRNTQQMQGDLARTSTTPANAMRALTTAAAEMGRAIGKLLTPIIVTIIPWIIAFTNVIKKAASAVAAFFGITIQETEPKDFTNMFEGIGDSVEDAGKKVKNSLAPFDDLNVVMSSTADSGDMSTSTVLKELQKYVEGYDMLKDLENSLVDKAKELEKYVVPITTALLALFNTKNIFDLGKWLSGGTQALGTSYKGLWGTGTVGYLIDWLITAAAVGIIIGCAFEITEGIAELNKLYALMGDEDQKSLDDTKVSTGTIEDAIKNGEYAKNPSKYVDSYLDETKDTMIKFENEAFKQNSNILTGEFWTKNNSVWTSLTGGGDESIARIKSLLKEYQELNKTDALLLRDTNTSLEDKEIIQERILQRYQSMVKFLTYLPQDSSLINETKKVMQETDALLESSKKHVKETSDETNTVNKNLKKGKAALNAIGVGIKNGVQKAADGVADAVDETNNGIKSANGTLSISETKTSTWGRLLGGVSNTVTTIKNKLLGNNDELDDSNNKTTLLGKAVNVVKGLFGDTEGEVENMNNQLNIGSSKTDEMYRLWSLIKGELPGIEDKIKGVNMTTEDWRTVLEAAGVTVTDDLLNNFVEFSKTAKAPNKVNLDTKDADTWLDNLKGDIKDLKNPIKLKFSSTFEGLSSLVKNVGKAIFGEKSAIGKTFKLLGFDFSGFFAEGGYPTAGDLFFANENGRAEFITSIGNKTAVANQDQMVQALSNAIMAGFNAMNANNNTTRQPINVNIGNERVYSGVVEYQNRQSDRYGTTTTLKV